MVSVMVILFCPFFGNGFELVGSWFVVDRPNNTAIIRRVKMKLRPYQSEMITTINRAWSTGYRNLCLVLPMGSGKTVIVSRIVRDAQVPTVAIAHRQELVEQISLACCSWGVYHGLMAPRSTIRYICHRQMEEAGECFYDPNAPVIVGGVDTFVRRAPESWYSKVRLVIEDESHHILRDNKWGKALALFPNARLLGVTATPLRSDGLGLSRETDGLMDHLIVGPSMRDLITQGFLTDYKIYHPDLGVKTAGIKIAKDGDYNRKQLSVAVREAKIHGGIVDHYRRLVDGKRAVVFCASVEEAAETAAEFRAHDIPAAMVCAKTPERTRREQLKRFKTGDTPVLCNVDLFGEGFDVPAIEVVIMARPTASYGLYAQQFGRALRLCDGKTHGIIIDHVGNVVRHGLPDAPRDWTLDRREKRSKKEPDELSLKTCAQCLRVYPRIQAACPYCAATPTKAERESIEAVDGDLIELSPEVLAAMRREVQRVDGPPPEMPSLDPAARGAVRRNHAERQQAQATLRSVLEWWLGRARSRGLSQQEAYRLFYAKYGVDVMTAHTLGKRKAYDLSHRMSGYLGRINR